jgi:putative spermidine/putrescine transport system permease protein
MKGYRPGPLAIAFAILIAVFLLMPLLAVVPVSFTPARFLSMPNGELSLRHYRELFENPAWGDGILLSLRIGIVASLIATTFAVAFGLGIWMLRPPFMAVMVGFVLLPMVVPPVVSALTLYFLLTGLSKFNDLVGYDTWLGVALAHVVMITPFAVVLVLVALSQVDRRIDTAARGLGASVAQRAFRIILPNIKFGIVTALLLSFVLSWEEIGVTLFVSSVNAITLPRLMWMGLRDNIDPAIAAISVLLILLTVSVLLVRLVVQRVQARRAALQDMPIAP